MVPKRTAHRPDRIHTGKTATGQILARLSEDVTRALDEGLLDPGEIADLGPRLNQMFAPYRCEPDTRAGHFDDVVSRMCELVRTPSHVTSSVTLVEPEFARACAALGFRRALLSTVDHGTWQPEYLYVDATLSDHTRLRQYLSNMIDLSSAPLEADVIRRRTQHLVVSPHTHQLTYKPLMQISASHGFAVAPLVSGSQVIGMIHGDQFDQVTTGQDLERVVFLSEMVGVVAERLERQKRLTTLRDRVANIVRYSEEFISGRVRMDPFVTRTDKPVADRYNLLTPRQHVVLSDLAAGLSNAEIARELGVSEATVKSHVKQIFHKLGVHSRAEATARHQADRNIHGQR
ncbi:response regulator transcription factor [Nocardia jiangxiensis]|uniref:Response regulator transcription factor n=1 Tax=Nocardia jiangxiensis TaxID=282685 RepID=A0ABW6SBT9_9NOCA|nr:response regulator transcription factor [Nocardia jiangxiensis]